MSAEKLHPEPQEKMSQWSELLRGWHLNQLAAVLLEAAGPFNILGAQLVYLSQPMLNGFVDDSSLSTLAEVLEERDQTKSFIQLLKEDAG